ncbi:MAG: hypothetical protein HOY79_43950 [Streptomyces sp.]|nr:hypothetical protein [Streptomyces sp.]
MKKRFYSPVNAVPAIVYAFCLVLCVGGVRNKNHSVVALTIVLIVMAVGTILRYSTVGVTVDDHRILIRGFRGNQNFPRPDVHAVAIKRTHKGSYAPVVSLADDRDATIWVLAEARESHRLKTFDQYVIQWIDRRGPEFDA